VKTLIAHPFYRWSQACLDAAMSGLLVMEASSIPVSPAFSLSNEEVSFAKELSDVELTVRGVSIGAFAKATDALARWFSPQPNHIGGSVYIDEDKRLCARLSAALPERKNKIKTGTRSRVEQFVP
jgi:hypothetical protein